MKSLLGTATIFFCFPLALPAADISELAKNLKDKDPDIRRAAAKDLADARADARPALGALVTALKDSDLFVRRYAAQAVGAIGPEAKSAIPNLTAMLRNSKEKKEAQEAAALALGKFGTPGVGALTTALKDRDKDPAVRRAIVASLASIGPDARAAIPSLTSELNVKEDMDKKKKTANPDSIKSDVVTALGSIASSKDTDVIKRLEGLVDGKKNKKDKNFVTTVHDAVRKIKARK